MLPGQKVADRLRQEARATLRLLPWVLVSLLAVALLWRMDLTATGGLFQSPGESPIETPTSAPTQTATVQANTPTATNTATVEEIPTQTQTPLPTVTSLPSATPTSLPTMSPSPTLVTPTPTLATATVTPSLVPTTAVPPTPTRTVTATLSPTDTGQRYAEEDSNLIFDTTLLIDSLALGLSYLWLACGVVILLGIPIFFVILWWVGKQRRQDQE